MDSVKIVFTLFGRCILGSEILYIGPCQSEGLVKRRFYQGHPLMSQSTESVQSLDVQRNNQSAFQMLLKGL